ncbi:efflux transporter outer membrane subunit [Asticcacaulis sp. 201]|uniref:efflux transporter outer membrane subunit n=1 Tax=Asticcacaulis sp. 201 TaxID=3028787 RepID=UPI002916FE53|nr:efflux transporter outer membrane subunit [Asticcacaulis sp. 201]MDV6331159.1 efflux transporter outer membrane subunit [Asticcacaulis sp. 201]
MKRRLIALLLLTTTALSACSLAPSYVRTTTDFVAPQWPTGAAYPQASEAEAGMTWRELIEDNRLRQVIDQALTHNQDLAAAIANVASVRAQYRSQKSSQLPSLTAGLDANQVESKSEDSTSTQKSFSASIGISAFELDLFGRQRNLSKAAFEQYLSSESGERASRLTIISETATAYVTLAANMALLETARAQVTSAQRTLTLTQDLHKRGLISGSDVANAETTLAQAHADIESYTTTVAQNRNALELLTGGPVADALLPTSLDDLDKAINKTPAGLSSSVLLNRPDVIEAEHTLKATYSNIGAARAAYFPTISLTSTLGTASEALSSLFSGDNRTWTNDISASMPIIGGSTGANVAYRKAQRDYYLAQYRKAAQNAYKDISDALARQGTLTRQRAAQSDSLASATRSYKIADARYREGVDSFLPALVSQRTLYSAQQASISLMLTDLSNRIAVYQALGADNSL